MSKISEYLAQIKAAIYGREVRDAIHDSIEQCYTDVSNAKTLADTAASNTNAAISKANTAASNADTATNNANTATSKANTAAETVQTKLDNNDFVPNITFTVETGLPGTNAVVEQTGTGKSIALKLTIPRGDTGSLENIDEVLDVEFRNRDIVPLTNELIDSAIASAEGE